MRISRKTQNTIKNVVSAVLAIAILLGVASLIGGLTRADDEERVKVHPTFSVGGLNEVGKYVESEGTLYTKEAFECQGLDIDVDFEKTIYYEVFFYTAKGEFLSSTEKTNENSSPSLPENATHARIVITPDWDLLEITKEKEQVVKWYEVAKYANQLEIKVNEEQLVYGFHEYKQVSLTNSMFTHESGCYYSADGLKVESATYNSYVYTATESVSFYVSNDAVSGMQYVVVKDGVATRYKVENWVRGEDNSFELAAGDKVIVSLDSQVDMSLFKFYLAKWKMG